MCMIPCELYSEQEEVIEGLRAQEDASNAQNTLLLRIVVSLSALLYVVQLASCPDLYSYPCSFLAFSHLVYLLSSSKNSPFSVFLSTPSRELPTFISTVFAFLHLAAHLNLVLLTWPAHERPLLQDITPLPYSMTFSVLSVAPVLSIMISRSLDVVAWWTVALGVAVAQFYAQRWITEGSMSISELEGMRYDARGA